MTHQSSPILEEKYRWQEREYEQTKNLSTQQYARNVEDRVKRLIAQSGYRAVPRGEHAFTLAQVAPSSVSK